MCELARAFGRFACFAGLRRGFFFRDNAWPMRAFLWGKKSTMKPRVLDKSRVNCMSLAPTYLSHCSYPSLLRSLLPAVDFHSEYRWSESSAFSPPSTRPVWRSNLWSTARTSRRRSPALVSRRYAHVFFFVRSVLPHDVKCGVRLLMKPIIGEQIMYQSYEISRLRQVIYSCWGEKSIFMF